jgi:DNA repair exonuclease SbcCD ATPase subunit
MNDTAITEDQVFKTATYLAENGLPVTVCTLREALGGTGSYTTLSAHLDAWRNRNGPGENRLPEVPPEVERVMGAATQSLWHAAANQAQRAVDEIKQIAQQQVAQQEAELAEARQEIVRLEHDAGVGHAALGQARREIEDLYEQLAVARGELTLLQERTHQQDERLREHQAQLMWLQADAERERKATAKAQKDAEELRLTLSATREDAQEARREIARLEEEISEQAETLADTETRARESDQRAEQLKTALEAESGSRQNLEHQLERLQDKHLQAHTENEKLIKALEQECQRREHAAATAAALGETVAELKAAGAAEARRATALGEQLGALQSQLVELVRSEKPSKAGDSGEAQAKIPAATKG